MTNPIHNPKLHDEIRRHPHPLLFVTLSGAHLYGFPSANSDFDLRGVHVLPTSQLIGLDMPEETHTLMYDRDGLEMDLVTHDARKFFLMMLKPNGYVLEQLLSPLVLHALPAHEQLKAIGQACITRHHARHYLGFAKGQWDLYAKGTPRRVKPLLYVFRVLLTGIHLMRGGGLQADLSLLNQEFKLPYLTDLISLKREGSEKEPAPTEDFQFHHSEYLRLTQLLETSYANSQLPEATNCRAELDQLLRQIRSEVG